MLSDQRDIWFNLKNTIMLNCDEFGFSSKGVFVAACRISIMCQQIVTSQIYKKKLKLGHLLSSLLFLVIWQILWNMTDALGTSFRNNWKHLISNYKQLNHLFFSVVTAFLVANASPRVSLVAGFRTWTNDKHCPALDNRVIKNFGKG